MCSGPLMSKVVLICSVPSSLDVSVSVPLSYSAGSFHVSDEAAAHVKFDGAGCDHCWSPINGCDHVGNMLVVAGAAVLCASVQPVKKLIRIC